MQNNNLFKDIFLYIAFWVIFNYTMSYLHIVDEFYKFIISIPVLFLFIKLYNFNKK